jgi:hypothetical protein
MVEKRSRFSAGANRDNSEMPYKESFPAGTWVCIAEREVLDEFLETWKFHNPFKSEQLASAGKVVEVENVGFYHGGDALYVLKGILGVWHERCLRPEEAPRA